ncbi:MAG: spermidine/putrescine ABC transporter substrate-binding protein PotF, partial [Shewanella sp.]
LWFAMLAIPSDAQNSDNAHQLLNYLMRPDVIAKISDYVAYANANVPAEALMNPEIKNNPAIYPPADVMSKLFMNETRDLKAQRDMTRVWTRVKSGR